MMFELLLGNIQKKVSTYTSFMSTLPNVHFRALAKSSDGYRNHSLSGEGKAQLDTKNKQARADDNGPSTYCITRIVLLRLLGFVLLFAFLAAAFQNRALIGSKGLDPVRPGSRPTYVFDLIGYGDHQSSVLAWSGVLLSLVLVTTTLHSALLLALLWIMYLSIVNLGSQFIMHYGWEWQICETIFLVMFLCPPVGSLHLFPHNHHPPLQVVWLLRWLSFRVMLGAGLSKVHGSPCWQSLTCTMTHHLTQPLPNPLAWAAHRLPAPLHWIQVLVNHFVELVCPWGFLVPHRKVQIATACVNFLFQFCIISTGNYGFINWITMVPFLASLDDRFLAGVLPACFLSELPPPLQPASQGPTSPLTSTHHQQHQEANTPPSSPGQQECGGDHDLVDQITAREPHHHHYQQVQQGDSSQDQQQWAFSRLVPVSRLVVYSALVIFIAYKSIDPVLELTKRNPWLQFYDDWFFVNAYGVFGFINSVRHELVLWYTHSPLARQCFEDRDDSFPTSTREECVGVDLDWRPLDFKCLPGSLSRVPCVVTPYHYRLDWQAWIETTASMEGGRGQFMMAHGYYVPDYLEVLIRKILAGDTDAAGLMGTWQSQLFNSHRAPTAIRAEMFRYEFSDISTLLTQGQWWKRISVERASPMIFTELYDGPVSKIPWEHDYILLAAVIGMFVSLSMFLTRLKARSSSTKNPTSRCLESADDDVNHSKFKAAKGSPCKMSALVGRILGASNKLPPLLLFGWYLLLFTFAEGSYYLACVYLHLMGLLPLVAYLIQTKMSRHEMIALLCSPASMCSLFIVLFSISITQLP